jgi:hypothetical protein
MEWTQGRTLILAPAHSYLSPGRRIQLALSAWEYNRSGPLTALNWAIDAPPLTVKDPAAPALMARQWPVV